MNVRVDDVEQFQVAVVKERFVLLDVDRRIDHGRRAALAGDHIRGTSASLVENLFEVHGDLSIEPGGMSRGKHNSARASGTMVRGPEVMRIYSPSIPIVP